VKVLTEADALPDHNAVPGNDVDRAVVLDVHDTAADRLTVEKVDDDVVAWSSTGLVHVDQDAPARWRGPGPTGRATNVPHRRGHHGQRWTQQTHRHQHENSELAPRSTFARRVYSMGCRCLLAAEQVVGDVLQMGAHGLACAVGVAVV